ncbi:MAG: DNA polymerase I [Campylobacterota bacterium]|nr:DNA polymerase I [Campylobacterota bacterium]
MSKTLTIIDTFGFFFRSFYALPPLSNSQGFPTGLLTGFTNFISSLHKDHSSDYIIFALDSKGDTFRNEIDPQYKANRQAPPPELSQQLPIAIEWIEKMGFKTLAMSGFEADDIIASVTKKAKESNINVRVVSHDKDLYQLIDDGRVVVVDAIKRKDMDEKECVDKYSIKPEQFTDYQALLGDSADNVKGVKGIGKVTAVKLLNSYQTLENIYSNLDLLSPPRTKKLLAEGRENAFISKELVTLRDDVFNYLDFEEFKMSDENPFLNIYDELKQYEMNAIIRILQAKKIAPTEEKKDKSDENFQNYTLHAEQEPLIEDSKKFETILLNDESELINIIDSIPQDALVAYDTETTGLDAINDTLVGFSFAYEDSRGYYVPVAHNYLGVGNQISKDIAIEAIKKIFTRRVVAHNAKYDLHITTNFTTCKDIKIYADTIILAWLNAPESPLSLDKLAYKYYQYEMMPYSSMVKKNETFASVELEKATQYAAEDAVVTFWLYETILEVLKNSHPKIIDEAYEVEFRFIETLMNMEIEGIKVDTSYLLNYKDELSVELNELTKEIHLQAKREFNINSPKQLGVVLFEELELPPVKKTKTGYSTDEKVLNQLIDEHEIIKSLLRYRELNKLRSTYVEPIIELASKSKNSKIHTSFNQTRTATGRLSSTNPNLQNIPTRTAQGMRIREAFIADSGKTLVGIDYSQIELRLLAHFSKDSVLVDAFNNGLDIHMQTAITLFGEDEAASKRHIAKTVNFGVLYGMGQKKLAQTLKIEPKEAKAIIDKYFQSFPTLKSFFKDVVDGSKSNGYVETLLGRRRYFDYENARPMFKAAYERESVNTIFQGSASDLIKLAMNKIDEVIIEEKLNAKMLLQIHDELIFEVSENDAQILGKKFQDIMENIIELSIPLETSLNISKKWSGLK